MDTERPHRSTTTSSNSSTSELFVCFTSRLSSSSMKLSSKSLLSPSRSRDPPQISLSSSLSRRLRSNGSMKGGQASPMFPTTVGKRRGCGFENPEPSSPKVTCIGQVRVKTKKQGKKMRARSKRRTEASFRKTDAVNSDLTRQNSSSFQYQNHQNLQQECLKHRNQRWVHLPLTICEALREFNCFFPCRSSCMREKGEKGGAEASTNGGHHHHHGREGSCGAAFARWLQVAMQEGGDGKGREIEVVMREDEAEDYDDDGDGGRGSYNAGRSHRRHVFEDIDIDLVEGKKEKNEEGGEEEKARVSICIPPKNALLLMRCRSDPVKMAALANRFWESPVQKDQHEDEDEDDEDEGRGNDDDVEEQEEEEEEEEREEQEVEMEEDEEVLRKTEEERNSICEREREGFENSEENHVVPFIEKAEEAEPEVQESLEIESRANPENDEAHEANEVKEELEEAKEEKEKDEEGNSNDEDENLSCVSTLEAQADPEEQEETQEVHLQEGEEDNKNHQKEDENDESLELSSTPETLTASEPQNDEAEPEPATRTTTAMAEALTEEEASTDEQQQHVTTDTPPPPPEVTPPTHEGSDPNNEPGSEERESGSNGDERGERETLPECLLLMMCEPKLSMEVSKETWVRSTDFIRWLPERPAGKNSGAGSRKVAAVEGKNGVEKKSSPAPAAPPVQPPRSSCSFPAVAGVSMAAMIEQRLAAGPKSNGYEPFVLTRCKSEPMRSSAKLSAEACFWKKPHAPPATLGVGAPAGVGF